jgi:hypothetical protein
MEEGCTEIKRLSYLAKFKCEVVLCIEEKGNCKATAISGVDENNVRLWRKHKAVISKCEVSQKKFTGSKKGQFPETDDVVFTVFQKTQDWSKLYYIFLMADTAALYHFSKMQLSVMNLIYM